MFDSKIVMVVRNFLKPWQELNVAAFLMSGIIGASPEIIGEPYKDLEGNLHLPLCQQPVVILYGHANTLRNIRMRANARGVITAVYIEEMFKTGNDSANRGVFSQHGSEMDNTVGIAFRAEKKLADKVSKGAKMQKEIYSM